MPTTIALLADIHFRDAVPGTSPIARRECRRMGEVLDRCLDTLASEAVDLVLCAGDCLDDPTHPAVPDDLATLHRRFAASGLPAIILPGNHDPAPADFYQLIPPPPPAWRLDGVEVLPFGQDACPAGEIRAVRTEATLRSMQETLATSPPGVALTLLVQHYVIFPEHTGTGYPHNYANDAAIRATMEASPRRLVALSGHYHRGFPLTEHRGVTYFTGRALCERPFPYYLLRVEGTALQIEERCVELPA